MDVHWCVPMVNTSAHHGVENLNPRRSERLSSVQASYREHNGGCGGAMTMMMNDRGIIGSRTVALWRAPARSETGDGVKTSAGSEGNWKPLPTTEYRIGDCASVRLNNTCVFKGRGCDEAFKSRKVRVWGKQFGRPSCPPTIRARKPRLDAEGTGATSSSGKVRRTRR